MSNSASTLTTAAFFAGFFATVLAGCQTAPAATADVDRGAVLYANYCAQCHGADAEGWEAIGAPSIAGLPEYYVLEQLHKFRSGARGAHFDDAEGLRMRPMSLSLSSEVQVQSVAKYVAAMTPVPSPPTLADANAEAGKAYYATCTACHGPDGQGNEALGSPPLTLQPDWYLVRQLHKFKSGIRGTNPKDRLGSQMIGMARTLPNDQAVKDVVAHIQSLRK